VITIHADVVGSLLRPPELLAAQQQLAVGAITAAEFKLIEDRAVDDAVALQESVGLKIVTDGEMRRQSFQSQMTAAEFSYLKSKTNQIPKITLPSPGLWANFWSARHSKAAYPTLDSFLADIVQILRDEVKELVRLGASYVQIDAPHYGLLLDPNTRGFYEGQGWSLDRWLGRGLELDNAVMDGFPDVTFGFHI